MLKDLEERIAKAKGNDLTRNESRIYLVEPVLKEIGFPLDDIFRMKKDYLVTEDQGINYVYLNDQNQPVIAICAQRIHESIQISDIPMRDTLKACPTLEYLLVTNGEKINLYAIETDHPITRLASSDVVADREKLRTIYKPENMLEQANDFWMLVKKNRVTDRITKNKARYWESIKAHLTSQMGIALSDSQLREVLAVLSEEPKKTNVATQPVPTIPATVTAITVAPKATPVKKKATKGRFEKRNKPSTPIAPIHTLISGRQYFRSGPKHNAKIYVENDTFFMVKGTKIKRPDERTLRYGRNYTFVRCNDMIDSYLEKGWIKETSNGLVTTQDIGYSSPTLLANLITGYAVSGWTFFKGLNKLRKEAVTVK